MTRTIAICIATYRRPAMLARLLAALAECDVPEGASIEVRVADNDVEGSADEALAAADLPGTWNLRTTIEARRSIAHARNAAVAIGPADVFLFIDDDERPPRGWITDLVAALDRSGADAVVGRVMGVCPPDAPAWLARGGFFDKPTAPEGELMDWRGGRTSNTAIRGRWFGEAGLRFDPAFGLTGAEDTELFLQIARRGGSFAGAPDVVVREDVEPERANVRWLWSRHVRGGRNYRRLCDRTDHPPHAGALAAARVARGVADALVGAPALLIGRPERSLRGALQFAVAWGGLAPGRRDGEAACVYPVRSLESMDENGSAHLVASDGR